MDGSKNRRGIGDRSGKLMGEAIGTRLTSKHAITI